MPIDPNDFEPESTATLDPDDFEPLEGPEYEETQAIAERMMEPAIAPATMPEGPDYGLGLAQQYGMPLGEDPATLAGEASAALTEAGLMKPAPTDRQETPEEVGGRVGANIALFPARVMSLPFQALPEKAINTIEDVGTTILNAPYIAYWNKQNLRRKLRGEEPIPYQPPFQPGVPILPELEPLPPDDEQGRIQQFAREMYEGGRGFTTPGTVATVGVAKGLHAAVPKPTIPEIYARDIRKTAKVYGDVRQQPGESPGQVPVKESGQGVQPEAPGRVAKTTEVPLKPAEKSVAQQGIDMLQAEVDKLAADPEVTGKRVVGVTASGRPKYEPVARDMQKVTLLNSLRFELEKAKTTPVSSEVKEATAKQAAEKKKPAPAETKTATGKGLRYDELTNTQIPAAHTRVRRALDKRPDDPRQLADYANLSARLGNIDEAEAALLDAKKNAANYDTGYAAKHIADAEAVLDRIAPKGKPGGGLMSESDAAYLEQERQGMDAGIELKEPKPGEPFAGQIATIDRGKGTIVINPSEFSAWLAKIPEARRAKAVASLLSEERIHLAVTDAIAKRYWDTLTAFEKAVARRRYTGTWSGKTTKGGAPLELTDTNFGHEAIRFRVQQLRKMTPRELAEAVGRERWTMETITAMESVVRGVRENLIRTKASKTAIEALNEVQAKLDEAKKIVQGTTPAAIRKEQARKEIDEAKSTEDAYLIGERITAEDIPVLEQAGKDALTEQKNVHAKLADLRRTIDDPEAYNQAATRVMQDGFNAGMKNQFAREAIKWRQAIDEAIQKGVTDEAEFGKIAVERGVGTRGEGAGKNLMEAVERERAKAMPEPEVQEVTPLDYSSGSPITGIKSAVQRMDGHVAAIRKGKGEEIPETKFAQLDYDRRATELTLTAYQMRKKQIQVEGETPSKEHSELIEKGQDLIKEFDDTYGDFMKAIVPEGIDLSFKEWMRQGMRYGTQLNNIKRLLDDFPDNPFIEDQLRLQWIEIKAKLRALEEEFPQHQATRENLMNIEKPGEGEPRVGPGLEPFAIRKGKRPEDHPELFTPKETREYKAGARIVGAPKSEKAPATEEVGKYFQATYEPLTPLAAEQAAKEYLEEPAKYRIAKETIPELAGITATEIKTVSRPRFQEFVTYMKSRFGPSEATKQVLTEAQLYSLWNDSVWDHLMRASGAELNRLQTAVAVGREGAIKGGSGERVIADPPTKPPGEGETALTPAMKHRYRVIANIANKLISEAKHEPRQWNRKIVEPDEIAFWKGSTEPAYSIISNSDRSDPVALGRQLVDSAGEDRTTKLARTVAQGAGAVVIRRKAPPVSVTRRLTVMQAIDSGRVEMVSTFNDGRRGPVLLDPNAPLKAHTPIAQIMKRYRPLYSILLDEPVQNFRKTFKNLAEYQEQFGREARSRAEEHAFSEAALPEEAGVLSGEYVPMGGEPRRQPTAWEIQTRTISRRGVLENAGPVREPEARSFYETLGPHQTIDTFVEKLHQRYEAGELTGTEWSAISVLQKLTNRIQRRDRSLTPDQAKEQAFNELKDIADKTQDPDNFAAAVVQRYAPQARPTVRGEPPPSPKAGETGRELTTLRSRAPTSAGELPKGPGPEPTLPVHDKVSMLTPEEAAAVEAEINRPTPKEKLEPSVPLPNIKKIKGGFEWGDYVIRGTGKGDWAIWKKGEKRASKQLMGGFDSLGAALDAISAREGRAPAAIFKGRSYAEERFANIVDRLKAWGARRRSMADIVRWRDGVDHASRVLANQAGNEVRAHTEKPRGVFTNPREYFAMKRRGAMVRAAAKAVVSSGWRKEYLDNYLLQIETGRVNAESLMHSKNPIDRLQGRVYLKAVDRLKKEVEYAKAHWDDADLQATAISAKNELSRALAFEKNNGVKVNPMKDYLPGRYEAEFFNDKAVIFGDGLFGAKSRQPKVFGNYYTAIQAGPYIPKSYDIADLVEHRVRSGLNLVNRNLWINTVKSLTDPVSKQPVVMRPKIVDGVPTEPSLDYKIMSLAPGTEAIAVRKSYASMLSAMVDPSGITKTWPGKFVMGANGILKHGVILIFDSFHIFRLGQYGLANLGVKEFGFQRGWSALAYREESVGTAVKNGWVSPKSAAWAEGEVKITLPSGKVDYYTRRQVLHEMVKQGLNVGRIQDAIYMDIVSRWPLVGTMNKFTFEKLTRGLMAEAAVKEFEAMNAKFPNRDVRLTMKEVIRDINVTYGSIGRQGWIKNPTIRDISQLLFLAPQWVEGLIKKEAALYWRLAKSPYSLMRGEPVLGTLGKGMARGLVSYFVLTQIINLITRKQLTFQNKEKDHQLDAWVPTGNDGSGFWLSPLSVFGEVTHDIIRLSETKPTFYEALRQIGMNKLGPIGRMMVLGWTRENEQGQRVTSTGRAALAVGQQLAPAPISLGTPLRYVGHKILPGLVQAPRPGALWQRAVGAAGIKVQTGETNLKQAQVLANDFVEKNNLKPDTGFIEVPTDQPSYAKLRRAIANDDLPTARSILKDLREDRTEEQIVKAMMMWAQRPMTGSWPNEALWLGQMDRDTFILYSTAIRERQDIWKKWMDFYIEEPVPVESFSLPFQKNAQHSSRSNQ